MVMKFGESEKGWKWGYCYW